MVSETPHSTNPLQSPPSRASPCVACGSYLFTERVCPSGEGGPPTTVGCRSPTTVGCGAADEVVCHFHFNCGARGRSHPHPLLAWYQVSYFVVAKIELLLSKLMGGDPSFGQEVLPWSHFVPTTDGTWPPDCLACDIPRSLKAPTVLESDCCSL